MNRAEAILVGAGSGERLGLDVPKAFAAVGGEALLVHAVRAFERADSVDRIVVVVGPHDVEAARGLLRAAGVTVDAVCAGGARRQDSVRSGLAHAASGRSIVAVHDVARPLVSPALVDSAVAALTDPWAAVAPALPVVDTLKLVEGGRVVRTVDRRGLWTVQTPQVFARRTLETAHDRCGAAATDDLVLVEEAGGLVRLIEGERRNFKITYPEDLAVAAALLRHSPA